MVNTVLIQRNNSVLIIFVKVFCFILFLIKLIIYPVSYPGALVCSRHQAHAGRHAREKSSGKLHHEIDQISHATHAKVTQATASTHSAWVRDGHSLVIVIFLITNKLIISLKERRQLSGFFRHLFFSTKYFWSISHHHTFLAN